MQDTSIRKLILQTINDGTFPGASLFVAREGKPVLEIIEGSAELAPLIRPVTQDTIWDIASLTKPLATAFLMMLAVQEKKCSLDDSLLKFFPETKNNRILLRHLLNHTSGLPDWKPYYLKPDVVQQALSDAKQAIPQTEAIYSDVGYILLGAVLEKIYGEKLDRLFEEKIAKPLQLTSSFFNRLDNKRDPQSDHFAATEDCSWRHKLLCGEVMDDNASAMDGVAGHAGLFSTARDIHRILEEFRYIRVGVGSSPSLQKQIFDAFTTIPKKRDITKRFFTLGFDTPSRPSSSGHFFSPNSIGHLGYSGCSFWWDLDKDFWIILLTNRVHPKRDNDKIKTFRPQLHDAILRELGLAV